jgi:hypothetical protein
MYEAEQISRNDPTEHNNPITLRAAQAADERALERLAQLDSSRPLEGPMLLAEVSGELRAARSLKTGETIADPFHHTEHMRGLLAARAAQLIPASGRRQRFSIRLPRLARAEQG